MTCWCAFGSDNPDGPHSDYCHHIAKLDAEIKRLKAELRAKDMVSTAAFRHLSERDARISELEASAAGMREALQYYADENRCGCTVAAWEVADKALAPESGQNLLARMQALERVAEAARVMESHCDCGCQCGYYTETATEEADMDQCGLCAVRERIAALDQEGT